MNFFKVVSVVASLFMACGHMRAQNPNVEVIPPEEFSTRISSDPTAYLLDVRKPEEYAAGHIAGAHLSNWLDTEYFKQKAVQLDKTKTIYIYCRSGRRSNDAAQYLASQGYKVVDLSGGILAWEEHKLPIER